MRLADFGIARSLSDATRHTATGETIGTAGYLAPEQVRGDEISPLVDIYALGLVLIEVLTGERMYEGSPMVAALARLDNPPRIPAMLSDGWKEVLSAMPASEPEHRATAFEVTQLLGVLASQEADLVATASQPSLVTHAESAPGILRMSSAGLGPDERVAAVVPAVGEGADLGVEITHGPEGASVDGLLLDDAEPRLDHVQPGPEVGVKWT